MSALLRKVNVLMELETSFYTANNFYVASQMP